MRLSKHFQDVVLGSVLFAAIVMLTLTIIKRIQYDGSIHALLQTPVNDLGFLPDTVDMVTRHGFTLTTPDRTYSISSDTLRTWFQPFHRAYTDRPEMRPNHSKINAFLTAIASETGKPAIDSQLDIVDGVLRETTPARSGRELDITGTTASILNAMRTGTTQAPLSFLEITPTISATTLSQLGVTALLGKGESNFTGSPHARAHNIAIGAQIFNNLLVQPGQEFSFDSMLGDVDETKGYLPELVIRTNKIIPEYGGGLCQVSTTLFRAAIAAGLEITERHPHSLPVHYYNPQGYDAAVYPGVIDLKFKNDTKKPILIQSHLEGTVISFSIFGSNDGRTINVEPPQAYEKNNNGSLKTVFTRVITYANGTQDKKAFYSAYRAPSSFTVIHNPLE